MTDDTDERPFQLSDGECVVFDPSYLDVEVEAVGVLAAQFTIEGGLWALVGSHDDSGRYSQGWVEAGRKATSAKLRPVN